MEGQLIRQPCQPDSPRLPLPEPRRTVAKSQKGVSLGGNNVSVSEFTSKATEEATA